MRRKRTRSRRKRTRRPKRRTTRRRRRGPSTFVNRGANPVADRTLTRFKYCETIQIADVIGSPNYRTYRLNSISSPSGTLTSAVPYSFATYELLYDRYRVWKCRWRAEFSLVSQVPTTIAVRMVNGIMPFPTSWDNFLEQPRTISLTLGPSGMNVKTICGSAYMPNLRGITRKEYMDDDYACNTVPGVVPVETFQLVVASNSNVASWAVQCKLTMVFFAELFEPRPTVL